MAVPRFLKFLAMLPAVCLAMRRNSRWERHYLHGSDEPTTLGDYLQLREQCRYSERRLSYERHLRHTRNHRSW